MKRSDLKVIQRRNYKVITDSQHQLPVAQNILNREFSPQAPNQAWVTDIAVLGTQIEAIADVPEYVGVYYNSRLLHSTPGYRTPMDYEQYLNKMSEMSGSLKVFGTAGIGRGFHGSVAAVLGRMFDQFGF